MMTTTTLERWVAAGHLIRVYRGVYAVGHLPTTPIDRAHGALLAAGKRSALSHSCALVLWGVWRYWPRRLEVTTAVDHRPSGLKVHLSRTLMRHDVVTKDGLRVTGPPRTALDFSATATPEQLHAAVDHLRLRHGLKLEQLVEISTRNPSHPGKRRLLKLIGEAGDKPRRSGFERQWPAFARRHGLPPYEQNATVAGFEVDVLVAGAVVVELDTFGTHLLNFESDRARDATILAATGIPTIRISRDQFKDEPQLVAQRILASVALRVSE
jgi:very-short-patch-repair endonuclease